MRRLSTADEAAEELLDRHDLAPAATARSLAELDRVNRALLAALPLRRTLLPRLVSDASSGAPPCRLLDLGTGSGEVAGGLARAAGRRGVRATVVGLDRKVAHLALGRRRMLAHGRDPRHGGRQLRVAGDAAALPFRDGAFAWSFSTLFFHHFDAADNRRVLAEMRRVARAGAAVVDLRRSRLLLVLVRLVLPLLGAGPVTRNDGRASVRRAWTIPEVARLVAGEPVVELRRRFPFRFSLVLPGGGTGRAR
jgi:ubiquinone/menaquinone biosynthesis C-methylase UbiE